MGDLACAVARNRAVVTLTVLGVVTTAYLAYTASSAAEAAALAILSSMCQVLASVASVKGRADPNFVKSAVGRLLDIGVKIRLAELRAQVAYEEGTPQARKETLGVLSVTMSFLQEETRHALEDWKNLDPETVETLEREEDTAAEALEASAFPQEAPNV